ncbi:uncharacterized protein LOC116945519 isoform X5 [Petromyzon marinus]|uniref:uncharacterized protein LOC116945519 isoform X5 n=1 Tax=Petromyzon marinus TaxID=7757 RepID=UPI003F716E57
MDRRPCSFQTLCSRLSFVLLFMMMVGPHGVHAQHGRSKFKSSPCRIFGVFHVEAVAGMNWFSFEDAEAACVSLGASLVTKDELVRAMKEGHFEACRYGWVKEKEVYLPRVTMHRKCGRSVLGLIQSGFTSGKKYDAFCFDRNEKRKNSCEKDRKRLTITTATTTPTRRSPTSPPRTSADRRTDSTATAKPEGSTPSLQPNKTNNSSEKDSKTLNITTATTASTRRSPTSPPRMSADRRTDSTATAKPEASTPSLQPNQINNSSEKDSKTLTITTATTALTRRSPTSPPRMSADRRTDSMATAKPEASTPSLQPNKTNNSSEKDSKTLNITTATTTPTRRSPTSPPRTSADWRTDSTATAKPEASTPSLQPMLDAALGHGSSGSGAQLLTTEGMKLEPSNTQDWKHPVLIILIFVAVVIATAAFCVLKCRRKKKTKRFPVETSIPLSIKVKVNAKAVDGGESEKQCMDGDVVVEVVGCRGEHASASYKEYVKGC